VVTADRGLSRRRLLAVAGATAFGGGVVLAYPTSAGHSTARSALPVAAGGSGGASGGTAYVGDVVQTRWGPVQVSITVSGGTITGADAVQVPSGNPRDQEINSYAVPVLDDAVLKAQSAQVDTVSGATVTSEGYLQSLQSAIDAAQLG
jgi:uncharacterized protein with FMN-binding domain